MGESRDPQHTFVYEPAGAREVLLSDFNENVPRYGGLRHAQDDSREAQAQALMSDAVQLLSQYGLLADRPVQSRRNHWSLLLNQEELWIVVSYRASGGFKAWGPIGTGGRMDDSLPVNFGLDWDPIAQKWLGPRTGERDFSAPGAPHRRIDALEAMVIAILEARRLCMGGSKGTP